MLGQKTIRILPKPIGFLVSLICWALEPGSKILLTFGPFVEAASPRAPCFIWATVNHI